MAAGRRPFMTARKVSAFDVVLIVWICLWVLLGFAVGRAIWDVGGIADPVIRNAGGLSRTVQGLDSLRSVPLVGGALGSAVEGVSGSADKARAEAQAVKDRIHQVGFAAGLLIALGPSLIALAFYLPFRLPLAARRGRDPRGPRARPSRSRAAAVPRPEGDGGAAVRHPAQAERRPVARHRDGAGRASRWRWSWSAWASSFTTDAWTSRPRW